MNGKTIVFAAALLTLAVPANAGQTNITERQSVVLDAGASVPGGALDKLTHSWRCSDGYVATGARVVRGFNDGGTFTCTLTVTDDDGLSSTATASFSVAHVAPTAHIAVSVE